MGQRAREVGRFKSNQRFEKSLVDRVVHKKLNTNLLSKLHITKLNTRITLELGILYC